MRIKRKPFLWIVAIALTIILAKITRQFFIKKVHRVPSRKPFIFENLKIKVIGADDMQGVERYLPNVTNDICNIPRLEMNNSEIAPFLAKAEPLNCAQKAEENWLYFENRNVMLKENYSSATCAVKYFERKNDYLNRMEELERLPIGLKMTKDFATVDCSDKGRQWLDSEDSLHISEFRSSLLLSAVKKTEVIERAITNSKGKKSGVDRLDVVIFSFDSMSQQHFRRKMPLAVKQLERMGAVIFNGYNIVGDGTPQAFIPILTGKSELEWPNTRRRHQHAVYVDEAYPFIWKNFSNEGYATLYAEDAFVTGTFTMRLKGFKEQPTDHYIRTFYKLMEKTYKSSNCACLGSEEMHKNWFRYAKEFLHGYNDVGRFLLMHQSLLSHDNINQIEVEDADFANFLKEIQDEGLLDTAALIVMADHGARYSDIRNTHQGQLEERLPMFSITLPRKFRKTKIGMKMHQNLMANKNKLTTPFDVHSTLLDLMKFPEISRLQTLQNADFRSLSMLRPIPTGRSCHQAGVEPHWCTCLYWESSRRTSEDRLITRELSRAFAAAINSQLNGFRNLCAPISWKRTLAAKRLVPNHKLLKYSNAKDRDGYVPQFNGLASISSAYYQLKIETRPNNAIYEATVLYKVKQKELVVDLRSISHISSYGDSSHCIINEFHSLAPFCVCKDKIRIKF